MSISNIARMKSAIQSYVTRNINQKMESLKTSDSMTAYTATVMGNGKVNINGKQYYYDPAVDIHYNQNETVYCLLNDNKSMAIIVGK